MKYVLLYSFERSNHDLQGFNIIYFACFYLLYLISDFGGKKLKKDKFPPGTTVIDSSIRNYPLVNSLSILLVKFKTSGRMAGSEKSQNISSHSTSEVHCTR